MIQMFSNSLGKEELKAIEKVFNSKWLGVGEETEAFEREFADKIGSKYALTYNSCTATLFSSMRILDIGPGDEVLIPSINFLSGAQAIMDCGVEPIFCDVDPKTLGILPEEIDKKKTKNTKAVMLLHYGGHPCDFDEIVAACGNITIIEDSANSVMSIYKGKHCGTLGDIGCFSFDPMKILVVGDGGMMTLQDEDLLKKAKEDRYLGLEQKAKSGLEQLRTANNTWWGINVVKASGRHITNDICSSVGRIQLKKIDSFIEKRRSIWESYKEEFKDLDWLELPPEPRDYCKSSYYLFWLRIKNNIRDKFAKYMVDSGIYVTFRYYPLHLVKYYGFKEKLPNSELANNEMINIPIHQNLIDSEISFIIDQIRNFKC